MLKNKRSKSDDKTVKDRRIRRPLLKEPEKELQDLIDKGSVDSLSDGKEERKKGNN